jgi:putative heme-binding domain-containing protein
MRALLPAFLFAASTFAQESPTPATAPTPQWIWDAAVADEEEVFFRRTFRLGAAAKQARLAVSCDNHCRVFLDGALVSTNDEWALPRVVDVTARLTAGEHVLAVHAWNDGGPAGLVLRLSWQEGGAAHELVSDAAFRCSSDDPDGWDRPGFDDAAWPMATVVAELGAPSAPWSRALGKDALGVDRDPFAPQLARVDGELFEHRPDGTSAPSTTALRLLDVPRELGSWVALCIDDRGRLYASDQRRGLYRIVPAQREGAVTTIERVAVELAGAQGLTWHGGALYAVVNGDGSGLYRLTDTDGDDRLDRVELLRALEGRGEHGPHAVIPWGQDLLVVCGNHTKLPELKSSRVPMHWREDRLLPRLDEPHAYWEGHSPPGGWVCRVDPDGRDWELIACGFRNPYDLAQVGATAVVYDADMEWDMGLPWYRPTRLLRLQSGVDYGWRIGSAKWPTDYPEAPAALAELGPGSPTGVAVRSQSTWQELWLLDWTFGTVYRGGVGHGLKVSLQPGVTGVPWPVADIALGRDAAYVVAGGRGLPSTLTRLPIAPYEDPPYLGVPRHDDPWDTFAQLDAATTLANAARDPVAARIRLEHLPVAEWRSLVLDDAERPAPVRLAGLLALARCGGRADFAPAFEALGRLDYASLPHLDRIAWLRVHALLLLRLGPATADERAAVARRLLPLFPSGDERQDQDLCELLAHVSADGLLEKALPLLSPMRPAAAPPWTEIARRSKQYGGEIERMIASMPPVGQLAIADALRLVERGWTKERRTALFTFLAAARTRSGGSSYHGFLDRLIDAHLERSTPDERNELAEVVGRARRQEPAFVAEPPRGPGRRWTTGDITALERQGFDGRDLAWGRNLFQAAGCASCHQFAGEGGFGGPDLTNLRGRFQAYAVLEAIFDPDKVVSEQYSGRVVTHRDGRTWFGVVHEGYDGDTPVYEIVPAVAEATPLRIARDDVLRVEPSPKSPMPAGLADRLSADEVRDLVAFLLSGGRR